MTTALQDLATCADEAERLLAGMFDKWSNTAGTGKYMAYADMSYVLATDMNPLSTIKHYMEFGGLDAHGGFEIADEMVGLEPVVEFGTREVASIVIAARGYASAHGVPEKVIAGATAALDKDPDPPVVASRIVRSAMQRRRILYHVRIMLQMLDLMDTREHATPPEGSTLFTQSHPTSSVTQMVQTFNQVAYAAKRLHNTSMMALN